MDLIVENYLEELYLREEIYVISEDISSFVNKFKPENLSKIKDKLKDMLKKPKLSKLNDALNKVRVPKVGIDKIVAAAQKVSSELKQNYLLAKRVLDNSFPDNINDDVKKAASFAVAAHGLAKKVNFKKFLMKFVELIRWVVNAVGKRLKDTPTSTIFEAVIGWSVIIFISQLLLFGVVIPMFVTHGILYGLFLLGLAWVGGFLLFEIYRTLNKPAIAVKIVEWLGGGKVNPAEFGGNNEPYAGNQPTTF